MFNGTDNKELELSAALVDLITARIAESTEHTLKYKNRFIAVRDFYDWCNIEGGSSDSLFDSFGVRAVLCVVRVLGGFEKITINIENSEHFEIKVSETSCNQFSKDIAYCVAVFSNFDILFREKTATLFIRKE